MSRQRLAKTTARGYGGRHKRLRTHYDRIVQAGQATCWRCGQFIPPGTAWDLGHDDHDRTQYRGPEHVRCNRGAPRRRTTQRAADLNPSRRW